MQFQAYGTTIIFATHSHELLRRPPTARLMRLEDGKITYANWPGATLFRSADQLDFEPPAHSCKKGGRA